MAGTPAHPDALTPPRLGALIAVLAALADQASKLAMIHWVMSPPRVIEVTGFFNLVLTYNRGVSFSLLTDLGAAVPWALALLALAIAGVFAVWLRRSTAYFPATALGLIVGGALGNVADRLVHGAVVDFLDFHLGGYHWPAFNLADSAIVVGVALLLIEQFRPAPADS